MKKDWKEDLQEDNCHVVYGDLRIWALSRVCEMTNKDIARAIGGSEGVISRYIRGTSQPAATKNELLDKLMMVQLEKIKSAEKSPHVHKLLRKFLYQKMVLMETIIDAFKRAPHRRVKEEVLNEGDIDS